MTPRSRRRGYWWLALAAGCLCPLWISAQRMPGSIDVTKAPYRAAGDGQADDTPAIQAALTAAGGQGGGTVFLPQGRYLVKGRLTVPGGTTLMGVGRAPAMYSEQAPGSTLLAVEGAGQTEGPAFLTLTGPNSTLEGITVFYPNQVIADEPVPYPWTVRGGAGHNVSLIDVLLVNPYQGVDFATSGGARHYVRGLYGQPLFKGIWVDKCYDIGRIHDVHFWPFWTTDARIVAFTVKHATAFIFQRTDWEVVENVFCWAYHVGIEFSASKDGAMNGQLTDVGLDAVDIGLDVQATQGEGIAFSNLSIANDDRGAERVAIWGRPGPQGAYLFIRGAAFWGELRRIVKWENSGTLSLSESQLTPFRLNGPMVELLAGRAMLHDNNIEIFPGLKSRKPGTAIVIGAGVKAALIHGNLLNENAIVNAAGERAAVSNNMP